MKMRRFKSNTTEVEALQWYGDERSTSVIRNWVVKRQGSDSDVRTSGGVLHIDYGGRSLNVNLFDWVVLDSDMWFLAIPPGTFDIEYEEMFIREDWRVSVNERTGEVKIEPPYHFVGGYRKLDMSRVEKANRHTDFIQELADLINKYELDEEYGLDAEVLANQTGLFYAAMYAINKEQ